MLFPKSLTSPTQSIVQDHFQSLVMAREEAEGANTDLLATLDELRRAATQEQPVGGEG